MSSEVQERLQREREAAAFLSSLGPQFEKVRSISPGPSAPAGKTAGVNGHGGVVANGSVHRPVAAPSSVGKGGTVSTSVVTVSREAEEKRQEALRRLKATHCSVNHEKVS